MFSASTAYMAKAQVSLSTLCQRRSWSSIQGLLEDALVERAKLLGKVVKLLERLEHLPPV
ncbi:hypothetical protein ACN6A1_05210 [Myxococcus virescens]|uniref:hypothetical protein n=1 Tax=Myxococcus virescens TaxID=83456 RepID=UPI003DA53D60